MSRGERIALRTGKTLCGVGLLLVSFVAYQLWGTALYESAAQSHLRGELASQLHRALPASAAPSRTKPSTTGAASPSTGLPALAVAPAPLEPDPAVNTPVGLMTIPAIGLSSTIVEGVGAPQLEQGPGHYPGTPLPGEPGNVSIAGHRTTYAHPFYDLTAVKDGDPIYILTSQGLFEYTVTQSQVVSPTDTAVLDSTSTSPTLTLTTCNPRYQASSRLVVTAAFTPGTTSSGTSTPASKVTAPTTKPPSRPARPARARLAGHDGLTATSESYWPGILWGLATVAVALVLWALWRRSPRKLRWLSVLAGIPLVAGGLLMCFEHISLALPGSY